MITEIIQENIASSKQGQQKHTMITKNGLLRPNRNSSLITNFKQKARPSKANLSEPDIDFNNIPTIQGTYKATKVNITAENPATGETPELTTNNIKETTFRRTPSQTIASKILDFVGSSTTNKPSTFPMKSTATLGENKWNERHETETKTITSSTTIRSDHPDVFKDFRNPDLETSPWRPIVPGYINTEFKLLPNDNTREKDRVESSTRTTISSTNDHRNDADVGATPSTILPLQSINFGSVVGMNTFDTDNTGFPRDRVVPGLAASRSETTERPDIEVAGQLPSETYSIKLKASSKQDDGMINGVSQSFPKNILVQELHKADSNMTRETQEKIDNSLSTVKSSGDAGLRRSEDREKMTNKSAASGVGVAEPVLDAEVKLNARNRYGSGILAIEEEEETGLRDRKVDVNPQRPIYTSYNTPDLNGDNVHRSSLISNSATMKPFRHTIPVDKIASVVSYNDAVSSHNVAESFFSNNAAIDADESGYKNTFRNNNHGSIDQNATLSTESETIVKTKTFLTAHNDMTRNDEQTMIELPSYEQIASTESNIMQTRINDELSRFDNNEKGSELKLIIEDADNRKSVSRNSTFVEIDTVKHTPGQLDDMSDEHLSQATAIVDVGDQQRKKIYNDTLKAYVVENVVTLAPAKSNTGIGRPVRPRPKNDPPINETSLLEQLFRMRNYIHEGNATTIRSSIIPPERFLPRDTAQTETIEFSEKEPLTRKGTVVQQIIEIVTSVSTKVSSSVKGNPIVLSLVTNSTTSPIIRANHEEDRSFAENGDMTEAMFLSPEEPSLASANLRTMQTVPDKEVTSEENRVLLDKLKQLIQIRTDDSARIARNGSSSSNVTLKTENSNISSLNIDELRKIADVVTGNETLKNANLEFTLSRDGVKIFTKVLNKAENRSIHESIPNVNKSVSYGN